MNIDKMKFMKIGKKEKMLVLKAFDINTDNLKCHYCKEKVLVENCSIMPSKGSGDPIILCPSLLCLTTYFEYVDNFNEMAKNEKEVVLESVKIELESFKKIDETVKKLIAERDNRRNNDYLTLSEKDFVKKEVKPITPTPGISVDNPKKFVDDIIKQSGRKDVKEAWDRCRKLNNKYLKSISIPVITFKENNWYIAKTPFFEDLCSQGKTKENAIDELKGMIKDCLQDQDIKFMPVQARTKEHHFRLMEKYGGVREYWAVKSCGYKKSLFSLTSVKSDKNKGGEISG